MSSGIFIVHLKLTLKPSYCDRNALQQDVGSPTAYSP